jgi:hypothetical protein
MAGYSLTVRIKAEFNHSGKEFLEFIRSVAKKYPVSLHYRTVRPGKYLITIDGTPGGKIDALFQELIINRGLYYYICSIKSSRKQEIISGAILPIYQELIESRFENPYSKFLRRHILGKINNGQFIPGYFRNPFSHEYEILFRRWDMGSLTNWDFIKDVDSLLEKFMLVQIGHRPGERSPAFPDLAKKAYKKGIGMAEEVKDVFNRLHKARTEGLHRMIYDLTQEEVSDLAAWVFNYFQFFEEFSDAQQDRTEKLHAKRYRRIKYGNEKWTDESGEPFKDGEGNSYDYEKITAEPCHDCSAIKGQYHAHGCDVEQCPRCKGQALSCRCKLMRDFD